MAERYRTQSHEVKATRWFRHGDHPLVKPATIDPHDHPQMREHWGPQYGSILGKRVAPGDWIVEEPDQRIYLMGDDEFQRRFEPC